MNKTLAGSIKIFGSDCLKCFDFCHSLKWQQLAQHSICKKVVINRKKTTFFHLNNGKMGYFKDYKK